jgi:MFS family permease
MARVSTGKILDRDSAKSKVPEQDSVATALAAEAQYLAEVDKNLKRNFTAQLCHGLLGQTGFRLVNAPTFIPAYIMLLSGGSQFMVGLALSLQSLGMFLTPILGASLIEHRKKVLPMGFLIGGAMRLAVLGIAVAGLIAAPEIALYLVCLFLLLMGVFSGMQGVVFNYLMSKVIPVKKRGRLTGLRNFLAGITASFVAYLGGHFFIGDEANVVGYSQTFLLAFVLTSLGLFMLLGVREPQPPTVRTQTSLLDRLGQLPSLLKSDQAFTRYFIARAVATLGRMATPFYILYAGEEVGLSGPTLAILTFSFTMTGTFSNILWGTIADRTGFRFTFLLSISVWVLSTILLLFSSGIVLMVVVFAGIGAAFQGFQNSAQNLTLEFGHREDLPIRIAVANTAQELAGTIGPVIGGVIAAVYSTQVVFICSIFFLSIGGLLVFRFVPEPRHHQ